MECGLDLPIINPNEEDMMSAIFAFNVLKNVDENAVSYIERYGNAQMEPSKVVQKSGGNEPSGGGSGGMSGAVSYTHLDVYKRQALYAGGLYHRRYGGLCGSAG